MNTACAVKHTLMRDLVREIKCIYTSVAWGRMSIRSNYQPNNKPALKASLLAIAAEEKPLSQEPITRSLHLL